MTLEVDKTYACPWKKAKPEWSVGMGLTYDRLLNIKSQVRTANKTGTIWMNNEE